ncbi:hypothetical protein [Candidatus Avelusimicrobium facis]|uniref:hypothetical protein n=1 Tax=Candidatus Avelusimicrobium facis TaxID=3416203 RepID=UPI003D130442
MPRGATGGRAGCFYHACPGFIPINPNANCSGNPNGSPRTARRTPNGSGPARTPRAAD